MQYISILLGFMMTYDEQLIVNYMIAVVVVKRDNMAPHPPPPLPERILLRDRELW